MPPSLLRERHAFTLIELLVVIVILIVLAGFLLPTASLVRARGDSAQCLAQLHQIGAGMAAYLNDHDTFPGPLHARQTATYQPNEAGSLAALLEGYLGRGATSGKGSTRLSPGFLCPAASRKAQTQSITTYWANMLAVPNFGQSLWGDIDQDQQPLSKALLNSWHDARLSGDPLSLAEMWALQDADLNYIQTTHAFPTTMENLLPLPAHGNYYNALFFDMHVASRKLIAITESQTRTTAAPNPSSP